MKVVITGAGLASYWYASQIGKVYEVSGKALIGDYKVVAEGLVGNTIAVQDCQVISEKQLLQEQLQVAKDNVAEIEKQLAEEVAKEITPLHATFMNHSTETLWEYVAAIQKEIKDRGDKS